MKIETLSNELGIGAPLVDRKNEVMRTMSGSEVRKARRTISAATPRNLKSDFLRFSVYFCASALIYTSGTVAQVLPI